MGWQFAFQEKQMSYFFLLNFTFIQFLWIVSCGNVRRLLVTVCKILVTSMQFSGALVTSKVQFRTLFVMMGNPKKIQSLLTDRWSALLYVENFFTHFWFRSLKGPLRCYKPRPAELRAVCVSHVSHSPKGHGCGSTPDTQPWDGATLYEDKQCWYACGSRRGYGRELNFGLHLSFSQILRGNVLTPLVFFCWQ